ncbi:MAG: hypothetical protein QOJ79_883 [Actinomycetota bacterium]|jgi:hypothetical protein|nr:hypothetical protein [Actinomycetota bacterium]
MAVVADLAVLSPEVAALAQALERVAAVAPADLPGALALEDARALVAIRDRLDVTLLHRVGDVDTRQLHALDAMPTAASWLEQQGSGVDRGVVKLSRRIGRLPVLARELDAGRLSMAAARQVAVAVDKARGFLDARDGLIDGLPGEDVLDGVILRGVPQLYGQALGGIDEGDPRLRRLLTELVAIQTGGGGQVDRVEAAFVALATRVDRAALKQALGELVDALLPQQLEDRAEQVHEERGAVLIRNLDGVGGRLEVELDAEGFEVIDAALAATMAGDPENVTDTAVAAQLRTDGLDPYDQAVSGRPRPRTMLKRRHDALVALIKDWLGSGIAGQRGKALPQISIRVGLDTLHRAPGALPATGGTGQRLPASTVRRLWCDSAVTRFVMGLGNKVIEMSHTARTLKAHERKAKLMETGGRCQAAACTSPPGTPLIPHHPDPYARSRTTSFYDTVLFCQGDHHHLHEGAHTIGLRDGRLLGPDGWIPQIGVA